MALKANDLGDLQIAVLRALWTLGEGTVYEVLGAITRQPAPAYTTVLTALRSLEKRGFLAHRLPPGERQYRYRPLIGEAEAERSVLCDVLEKLFEGSPDRLFARLLEIDSLDREAIAALLRTPDRPEPPAEPEPSAEAPAQGAASRYEGNGATPNAFGGNGAQPDLAAWRRTIALRLRSTVRRTED